MFRSIEEFLTTWQHESNATQKILDSLTDASLSQLVAQDHRTLGRIAWHIVTSLHEMLSRTGLTFDAAAHDSSVPDTAQAIADSYRNSNSALVAAIKEQWTDASLSESNDMYGEQWPNFTTLSVLISHQTHHRGQLTILMRQAGLRVPGVYGPSLEEWGEHGMAAPTV
jgi:uncharacterized damage-inducible protein DinB